jgi:hypothetical protein
MSNFNKWTTINDISMTSWMQLLWSCIIVENELSCNELHYIYNELQVSGVTKKLNCKASWVKTCN